MVNRKFIQICYYIQYKSKYNKEATRFLLPSFSYLSFFLWLDIELLLHTNDRSLPSNLPLRFAPSPCANILL